ncbi:MAG TPA: 16S rRNA (cytidine(1402)-2'-O)-methyltransferase [Actinomycetota bacterium]|nr:16S rRNA (cytidine(1402)-2'-O)-methyltransferase [Actinomycetota bacterium]
MSTQNSGRLYVVATPIGNLADITLRALTVLSSVDVIAAEDTRTTRRLLVHHGVEAKLVSYTEHNSDSRTPELLGRMKEGESVALVSEAGTPTLFDPGLRLTRACIDQGIPVEPVPGASALLAALVVSGLPIESFAFEGFLPRRQGERRRRLESLAADVRTLVFFESPHRVEASVADMLLSLGDRRCALCRELTKVHEEVRRGLLSEVLESLRLDPARGEIVVIVSGAAPAEPDLESAAASALEMHRSGTSLSDAARQTSERTGVPRRALYHRVLRLRDEDAQ